MFFACSGSMFFALMPELYRVYVGKNRGQTGEFPFSRANIGLIRGILHAKKGIHPSGPDFFPFPIESASCRRSDTRRPLKSRQRSRRWLSSILFPDPLPPILPGPP